MSNLRIGHGVDAHRLVEGRKLFLGGIQIPFEKGLDGHSDGDVAIHALADAILGAAGLGSMGEHFSSDDSRWAEASSKVFLQETAKLISASELELISAQVVIVCSEPRLAPFLVPMQEKINVGLGVELGVVTVGATTTDGLGFTGQGEGIAATAVALLASVD